MEIDYEKEYKEAFERAKRLRDSKYQTMNAKRVAEEIFPVLAESEDERMRKAALEGIEYLERDFGWDFISDIDILDVKEYLEKQKELPTNEEMLRTLRAEYEKGVADTIAKYEEKEQKVDIDKLRKDIYQSGYNDGYRHGKEDAQKEQKPVEVHPIFRVGDYVRNKRTGDKVLIEQINVELKCYNYVSYDGVADVFSDFSWAEQDNWELIGQKIEQKPAEWSEEDNEVLQQVIADIEDLIAAETSPGFLAKYNKHLDWLKLLPERFYLTPKQEWSEEDEKTINDACCWIAEYAGYLMNKNYGKASMLMGLTEKLKSLRPSWKPSEEQMKALNAINCHGDLSYVGQQNQLISLYNDLKKLI